MTDEISRCTEDAIQEFSVATNNNNYKKKPLEDIIADAKNINTEVVALEVIGWAIENVENYVDNTVKMFKLDLVLDAEETMQETKKLQDLYRAIPNDEDLIGEEMVLSLKALEKAGKPLNMNDETEGILKSIQECREILDKVVEEAHNKIGELTEYVDKLSERLVYYYEMKGVRNGVPLIQDLIGTASVIKFEYEAFNVGVRIRSAVEETENKDGSISTSGGELVNEYVVPEGFTVWIEIAFKDKRPQSMF